MAEPITQPLQRQTANKMRIGDILRGKPIIENEGTENPRFKFLELGDRNIVRVNIVANIVDKYSSEGEKKYLTFTIDDASGQIRLKIFGDDTSRFSQNITQGNTVIVIGVVRFYNNEIYISPEIIKITDPRYLLVRKLELDKDKPKTSNKEEIKAIKDQIIEMIMKEEANGGIDADKIVHALTNVSPDLINQEITKLLEEGLVYEPKPGKIRYLG
jgi:RPA family protein